MGKGKHVPLHPLEEGSRHGRQDNADSGMHIAVRPYKVRPVYDSLLHPLAPNVAMLVVFVMTRPAHSRPVLPIPAAHSSLTA